ncbi:hypothetical protein FKM82_020107 [Ascaphus truei]
MRRTISSEVLKAVTNDETGMRNRTITFTIVIPPKHGRLLKQGPQNLTEVVTSFTQMMVSNATPVFC